MELRSLLEDADQSQPINSAKQQQTYTMENIYIVIETNYLRIFKDKKTAPWNDKAYQFLLSQNNVKQSNCFDVL